MKPDGTREVVSETVFEYEYDKLSHWIRRIARNRRPGADEAVEITERAIEYYEP